MSLFGLIDEESQVPNSGNTFKGSYSTPGQVFSTSLESARLNSNSNSELEASGFALDEYVKSDAFKLDETNASSLGEEELKLRTELSKLPQFGSVPEGQVLGPNVATGQNNTLRWDENKRAKSLEVLSKLKVINPERYGSFDLDKSSKGRALKASRAAEKAAAGNDSLLGTLASFGGAVAASAYDPVEVIGAFLGAGAAKTVLKNVAIQATENVLIEGAKQPRIAKWQKSLGNDYGYGEVIKNLAAAGVFGGAIPIVKVGASKGLSKIFKSGDKVKFDTPVLDKAKELADQRIKIIDVRVSQPSKVFGGGVDSSKKLINIEEPRLTTAESLLEIEIGRPKVSAEEKIRLSEVIEEASRNPNLKDEVREALRDTSDHIKDLEDKPSIVSSPDHVQNIAEVHLAIKEGRLPRSENILSDDKFMIPRKNEIDGTLKPFNKHTLKKLKNSGEVVRFKRSTGEGVVIDPITGKNFKVNFSAIHTNRAFRNLKKGDRVKFNSENSVVTAVARLDEPLVVSKRVVRTEKVVNKTDISDKLIENDNNILNQPKPLSREELLRNAEIETKNRSTSESFQRDAETLKSALDELPDMTVEVDGKQIRVSDMVKKLDEDSAILEALSKCKVS